MSFSEIPERLNGQQDVDASWWNIIKEKLVAFVSNPLDLTEQATDPATSPASGIRKLFAKDDGFYQMDSAGNVTRVGSELLESPLDLTEQATDPATSPASGIRKLFAKDDGFYQMDSAGVITKIGSGGGGASGRSYMDEVNKTFESGVGDWVDDVNFTADVTTNVGEVLVGAQSLKLSKAAVDASTEVIKVESLTINPQDMGKTLLGQFEYKSLTGYSSGDFKVEVYDVTNTVVLPLAEPSIPAGQGLFQFNVNLREDTESVEIRIVCETTDTGASAIVIDEVDVLATAPNPTSIIQSAQPFTPEFTNFTLGNGTVNAAVFGRVGDRMKGHVSVTLGSTSSMGSAPTLTIPNGKEIDATKQEISSSGAAVGYGIILDAGSTIFNAAMFANSTTTLGIRPQDSSATFTSVGATTPMTWTTGDSFEFNFDVPIVGWSAGNLISTTEAVFSTAKARVGRTTTQSIASGTITPIEFNLATGDRYYNDGGHYNLTSDRFVSHQAGTVHVAASADIAANSSGQRILYAVVAGSYSETIGLDFDAVPTAGSSCQLTGSGSIKVAAGDTIAISVFQNSGSTLNTANSGPAFCWASFTFEPDFSVFGVYGEKQIKSSTSSNFDLATSGYATGEWAQMSGNSVLLTPGTHKLYGHLELSFLTSPPSVQKLRTRWSTENGDNTGTLPTALTIDHGRVESLIEFASAVDEFNLPIAQCIVTVTEPTTVYLNPRAEFTGAGTGAYVNVNLISEKIQ